MPRRPRSLNILFIVFIGGVMLSQLYSLDGSVSLYRTTQYLVFSCLAFALCHEFQEAQASESVIWRVFWLLGMATALLTTFQWIKGLTRSGMLPINPNFNAAWMAALTVAWMAKRNSTWSEKCLAVWLMTAVIFGSSRSALLGLSAGTLFCISHKYSRAHMWLVVGMFSLVAFFIPHPFLNRLGVFENGARWRIWTLALKGLIDYPLTGYGPGNFELAYLRHAFPFGEVVRYGHTTAFAHNDYLQLLCELGWPTAGLLFSALITVLWNPAREQNSFAIPAKGILITLAVAAFFNPIFEMPILAYLAVFCASYLLPIATDPQRSSGPKGVSLQGSFMGLLCATLLLVIWCGMRSYWVSTENWRRILGWNPHDAEAWHELAYQTNEPLEALRYHQNAVQESPQQPYYVEGLARALDSRPESTYLPLALTMYLNAIQLAPTRAVNDLAVASVLWRAGEPVRAWDWAEQALRLEPYYWECDLWKARCFAKMGDRKRAIFALQNLRQRRRQFLDSGFVAAQSPYENTILRYDDSVIQQELEHLESLRKV